MKIAYLHGRFGPHIMHGRLAKSLGAEFQKIDQYKRWNDGPRSKIYLIYAWFYNAFAFEKVKSFDYFLVSGPHFSPIIMKFFRLNKQQKLIVHLGDETMYFLHINWYGKIMQKAMVWALNHYDALFCEGQMAADLARLNGIKAPRIYTTYLGVPSERMISLQKNQPNLSSNHLVFISAGPKGWRTYYKGLDLMINAFNKAYQKENTLEFTIIGEWDENVQKALIENCSAECKKAIHFKGRTNDIAHYLKEGSLYFHIARGDAFPTVVLEAMSAGLIPMVSEWTGSKEVVGQVEPSLVVPLNETAVVKRLMEFIEMKIEDRAILSQKMREASTKYTEGFALKHYQDTFEKAKVELAKS